MHHLQCKHSCVSEIGLWFISAKWIDCKWELWLLTLLWYAWNGIRIQWALELASWSSDGDSPHTTHASEPVLAHWSSSSNCKANTSCQFSCNCTGLERVKRDKKAGPIHDKPLHYWSSLLSVSCFLLLRSREKALVKRNHRLVVGNYQMVSCWFAGSVT